MYAPILGTKLYVPPPRAKIVLRPRLTGRLDEGLCQDKRFAQKLTLISAPAGFGKTTLLSEWVNGCARPVAWLSLDEGENDPVRFLSYLTAALQTIGPRSSAAGAFGDGVLRMLRSAQPPPIDTILPALLNEIAALPEEFILILDDYHVIDSRPVEQALAFLIERLPAQGHLVIATREDPSLPLARYRARGWLAELRAADLRFTAEEAAEFLNQVMGLSLPAEHIAALEERTEGWIAGLQLAALSMQGLEDKAGFIQSFKGSHRFVVDYLVEEVLRHLPESIQVFMLRTSILERLCGSLCEAVYAVGQPAGTGEIEGQQTLEYLERANLFIIPLDNERRWYRYHHLFSDLLRQRLQQKFASGMVGAETYVNALHICASQWYEAHNFDLEAFQHAAAAQDTERAERLIEGQGIPLHFRGAALAILNWLDSLPKAVMDSRPSLWRRHAGLLLINGQTTGVEEKLQAAEAALATLAARGEGSPGGYNEPRNLTGQIAAARATLALTRYDAHTMLEQSHRALEYLHPSSLNIRANAYWTLGIAHIYLRNCKEARQALVESVALSQAAGVVFTQILATIGLGLLYEMENQLYQAAETYRLILKLTGDQPLQIINEAHLGLARILYEWNDLEAAERHGQQSLALARQYDRVIDRFINGEVFLARLKLARGDAAGAAAQLARASQTARQQNFVHRLPEVAAAQVLVMLRQGHLAAAANLVQAYNLPLSQARVQLAQGVPATLETLDRYMQLVEARDWQDERLKVRVLQALTHQAQGSQEQALQALAEALKLAQPGGFIRTFVDEGAPMAALLAKALAQGMMPDTIAKLLQVFETEARQTDPAPPAQAAAALVEPLSRRETEILRLIAQGLSNNEISERLFLALSTVKGHNRNIFDKLQVQRRTEAIARARELGIL